MKTTRILGTILLCIVFPFCASAKYVQLIYAAPTGTDIKKDNGYYVYENDTIKIIYSFWSERGVMSFMVYNKGSVPLYINWQKSAFISQDKRIPYYNGRTTTNFSGRSVSSGLGFASAFGGYVNASAFGSRHVSGTETVTREERSTFIPPKSYIFKASFSLIPYTYFKFEDKQLKEVVIDEVRIYESYPNDRIQFRNFLTYSTTEDFKQESYIDNEFYVKKIQTMKRKNFVGENKEVYYSPWQTPTRCYITDIKDYEIFVSPWDK